MCGIYACPGTILTISNCDAAGSYACRGDTLLQVLNTQGIPFNSNDDMGGSCGQCSAFSVTLTDNVCQYYTIREGCFGRGYGYNYGGSNVCSGTIHIKANTNVTLVTNSRTFYCDSFSSASFSASVRYADCAFSACTGTTLFIALSNPIGTPQAVLYDSSGVLVTTGYATLSHTVHNSGSTCQTFSLHQQCTSTDCSGTYEISGGEPLPTLSPTSAATRQPTLLPTIVSTMNPSFSVSTVCAAYSASNTLNAQSKYVSCAFSACPGTYLEIVASQEFSVTNIYVSLFDANGNELASLISADSISYTTSMVGECQTYTLRQGCMGMSSCQSRITVDGGAPASFLPTCEPTIRATFEPTSLVIVRADLILSASNQGTLIFPNLNGSIIISCSNGQSLQSTDVIANSNIELYLNNWNKIQFNSSVPTFIFDTSANGPTNASYIEIVNRPGSVCLNSTKTVVQFLSNRINLTYFSPSEGSEHGLDYVTVYPAYQITESFDTLDISNITVRCMYGPAINSRVSKQNTVTSYGQMFLESDTVLCSPGYADPLLPLNNELYRVVELWLMWYEGYNSTGGVSTSNLIRSELYGDYTFVHSTSTQLSADVTSTMPFPGSSYVFNPADNYSIVSYVEFLGVNQSRGAVMDLGSFISQCRFSNGSMNVIFYNFSANPHTLNHSQSDQKAAAMYTELGSFTGFFKLHSMDIALYMTLWSNTSLAESEDPLWCKSDMPQHSNVLSRYQRRRLSSSESTDCTSLIRSPIFRELEANLASMAMVHPKQQYILGEVFIQGADAPFL